MKQKKLIDIEVYPNGFMLGIKDYYTGELSSIEVSEWSDQRRELIRWLDFDGFLISFNGLSYDETILQYIKLEWLWLRDLTKEDFCSEIKRFSDMVIGDDWEAVKEYRWNRSWTSVDLYLYWSRMLRLSKKISLKSLGIQLGWYKVQELPYPPHLSLTKNQWEEIKDYNLSNDLGILNALCQRMKGDILLRKYINETYKIPCYSYDAPKIANEILLKNYCEITGQDKRDVRQQRFEKERFRIGDWIPNIKFETDFFQNLYKEISNSYDFFSKEFVYKTGKDHRIKVSMGVGGIHSILSNTIYTSNNNTYIYTSDIASLYPTNIINHQFIRFPELVSIYSKIREERLEAKRNKDKQKDSLLKLCLNSTSGLLDMDKCWFYSPEQANGLRITGQLQLIRTLELLTLNDFKVLSLNTDGLEVEVEKDKESLYLELMSQLEKEFNFSWEHDKYTKIVFQNINSYIAITESGKTKKKGAFVTEPELGNRVDFLVIPKCLELYFTKGTRPEEVMKDPYKYGLHIYDFCASKKVDKSYQVKWMGEIQQRLNRFYVSKRGGYLYKCRDGKEQHMLKDWGVTIYNLHVDKPFKDYQVETRFYLHEINKTISELEHSNQLLLFN